MRKRKYLSPSQVMKFEQEPEEYYIQYLAETTVPREPQTMPMAVGSGFDVKVKKSLSRRFKCPEAFPFDEDEIMAKQVENVLWRNEIKDIGQKLLEAYITSGAYVDLCSEVKCDLRMEFRENVDIFGIPFVIMPDIAFTSVADHPMIIDWKVNGYCANSNTSPQRGYVKCRDGWKADASNGITNSRGNGSAHKEANIVYFNGVMVNTNQTHVEPKWGLQLCLYGLGCGLTDPFIVGIDQLACKTVGHLRVPRVATHRWVCNAVMIQSIKDRVESMWEIVNSDHIFRNMSRDDSLARQEELERIASLGENYFMFR